MKIIQVHNYYQQAGGEDAVVEAEASLLRSRGNVVIPFYKRNDDISRGQRSEDGGQRSVCSRLSSVIGLLRVSAKTIWNHETYREFRQLLQTEKPDIVHCHNTFPLISPSIYWACAKESIPVVQTLHNYRLLCLNAFLFKQNSSFKCGDLSVKEDRTRADSHQPLANSPAPSAQRPVPSAACLVPLILCLLWLNKSCGRANFNGHAIFRTQPKRIHPARRC